MTFNDMEQLIRDYRWMKNEVTQLQFIIYGYQIPMNSWELRNTELMLLCQKVPLSVAQKKWKPWIFETNANGMV